jgi:drug/metabolite transporter (DMT)-like permease
VTPRTVGLLAALAAIWGGSYLLIKYALEDLSPPMVVWSRVVIGAIVLLGALRLTGGTEAVRGVARDVGARPWSAVLLGGVAVALPFTLITLGELEVPSGLTAVLISPASLFVALFAPFLDPTERIDRVRGVGMLMGLAGVALVVGVESVQTLGEFLGALAMVGAAVCYALSSFVVKGRYGHLSSMQTSLISVGSASVLTLPLALATAPGAVPGARAVAAVLALGAVGTALGFVIFYRLIADVGAGRASLVS